MRFSSSLLSLFGICALKVSAVTLTTSTASYVVDAGSANSLVVTFSRTTCDITSLKYMGSEVQYQSQGSHIGSGLKDLSPTVSATTITSEYILDLCSYSLRHSP